MQCPRRLHGSRHPRQRTADLELFERTQPEPLDRELILQRRTSRLPYDDHPVSSAVLEELSRSGLPTRAEVTDAAMGVRAEYVMLNKGPGMVAAVRALGNILRRMQSHQNKKQSMLRSLGIARKFNPTRRISPE